MRKIILYIALAAALICPALAAEAQYFTLKDSLIYSLENNPNIKSYGAKAQSSFAGVGITGSAYLPQVSASGAYSKNGSQTAATTDGYTDGLSLSQLVYDFNKTPLNIRMSKETYKQSTYDLYDTTQATYLSVIQAYYDILMNQHLIEAYKDGLRSAQQNYEQAKAFFEVGTKSKIDVTTASVSLENSKLDLINATNDLKTAWQNFYNALGMQNQVTLVVEDIQTPAEMKYSQKEILDIAYNNRRDILKIKSKVAAGKMQIDYYAANYFPALSGDASYTWQAKTYPLPRSWGVGLNLSWSIFDGTQTIWQVSQAKANLKDYESQLESTVNSVTKEVETYYISAVKYLESIRVTREKVRQAVENEDLATQRYKVGIGSIIELTDAQAKKVSAYSEFYKSVYAYNKALAQVVKSTGLDMASVYAK